MCENLLVPLRIALSNWGGGMEETRDARLSEAKELPCYTSSMMRVRVEHFSEGTFN